MGIQKNPSQPWILDREEVDWYQKSSRSGKSGQFARKQKKSSSIITLIHQPTGVEVGGEISEGHYSKKEMQIKCNEMYEVLFKELEKKVANALRIKGR